MKLPGRSAGARRELSAPSRHESSEPRPASHSPARCFYEWSLKQHTPWSCCLEAFFFFFFPDVLTAPANTSPSAPEPRTAMKTRKWAEKAKHRFPICSLPAFSWAIIQLQICDYSWQGLFISWETFGTTQCFCRECQPPGERVFQIRFFFFFNM